MTYPKDLGGPLRHRGITEQELGITGREAATEINAQQEQMRRAVANLFKLPKFENMFKLPEPKIMDVIQQVAREMIRKGSPHPTHCYLSMRAYEGLRQELGYTEGERCTVLLGMPVYPSPFTPGDVVLSNKPLADVL